MLDRGPVFVFGSNEQGRHGAGAAKYAVDHYGAKEGIGVGHVGNSYALPTKNHYIQTLPLNIISEYVDQFLEYARNNPSYWFMMTKIRCGLAGLREEDILPMFGAIENIPGNVDLPMDWDLRIGRKSARIALFENLCPADTIARRYFKSKPTDTGFALSTPLEKIEFLWDSSRSRSQNLHEAYRFGIRKHLISPVLDPENDGVTHINIYSGAKTKLGKFLSNFTHSKIVIDGEEFASIEAYWYWLLSDKSERDILKPLFGAKAKETGKSLQTIEVTQDINFIPKVARAIEYKIKSNDKVRQAMKESHLPFVHYYCFGNAPNVKVNTPNNHLWIIDLIETIRQELKESE